MIKRHVIKASIKEDQWKKLWQLKSDVIQKPFSKVLEIIIDDYFNSHRLAFDEDIKKKKEN